MSDVGFVGLGAMGSEMAARLIDAGNRVHGYNRTRGRAQPLIERGLIWCDTPREAAERSDVIFSMVADTAALRAITESADGILQGLRPGAVYVEMSTVSPAASRELAALVGERGAAMLDAPVSGSVPAAREGTLAIMVGGQESALASVQPLLGQLGETVTHLGANGSALVMKLAVNISLAVQMIAFSEGVLLAERGGIDRARAIEVMCTSAVASPLLRTRGPLVLDRPEQAWFDMGLMQKDIGLALEQARELAVPLPSAAIAGELLSVARALGYGEQDIVALFDVLTQLAGGEEPRP